MDTQPDTVPSPEPEIVNQVVQQPTETQASSDFQNIHLFTPQPPSTPPPSTQLPTPPASSIQFPSRAKAVEAFRVFGQKINVAVKNTAQTVREAEVGTVIKTNIQKAGKMVTSLTPRRSSVIVHRVPVVVLGIGGVGLAVVKGILSARDFHQELGVNFTFAALVDSSGALLTSEANDKLLWEVVEFKAAGNRLVDFKEKPTADSHDVFTAMSAGLGGTSIGPPPEPRKLINIRPRDEIPADQFVASLVKSLTGSRPYIVDCTATETTIPALLDAVRAGLKVVACNKKPFSFTQETYDHLVGVPKRLNQIRYESTVGAAIPVIATLTRTVNANDHITKIAGSFSGTLGFVMSELEQGGKFSEIVARAKSLRYTEPDPRDDLSGMDVARKALILARGLGIRMEMTDVNLEPLYPMSMSGLSVPEFLEALSSLDEGLEKKVQDAKQAGNVLRYAAVIENSQIKVGLTEVSADSPLGRLRGTDNLIEFHTAFYRSAPLVLQGAGAGVELTSAGVISDMIELAFARS